MEIKKKVWPEYFKDILSGKKKYELRLNDFEAQEGDVLILEEWDPEKHSYTGRSVKRKITCVNKFDINECFWPKSDIEEKGFQVLSLESID